MRTAIKILALALGAPILILAVLLGVIAANPADIQRDTVETLLGWELERPVRIDGDVTLSLSLEPELTFAGLRIADPADAGDGIEAEIGYGEVQFDLTYLFGDVIVLPRLHLSDVRVSIVRAGTGEQQATATDQDADQDSQFPLIEDLAIENLTLQYSDPDKGLTTDLVVQTLRQLHAHGDAFQTLEASGTYDKEAFKVLVKSPPVDEILASQSSFAIELDADFVDFDFSARGTIDPFDLEHAYDLDGELIVYSIDDAIQRFTSLSLPDGVVAVSAHLGGDFDAPAISALDAEIVLADGGSAILSGTVGDTAGWRDIDISLSGEIRGDHPWLDDYSDFLRDVTFGQVSMRATGSMDDLAFQDLDLHLAGDQGDLLSLEGVISLNLAGAAPGLKEGMLSVTFALTDSKDYAELFDPGWPDFGALALDAGVTVDHGEVRVEPLEAKADGLGGVTLTAAGRVGNFDDNVETPVLAPDLELSLSAASGARVLKAFGSEIPLMGALSARTRVSGAAPDLALNDIALEIGAASGPRAQAQGTAALFVDDEVELRQFDLMVSVVSPTSRALTEMFDPDVPELGAVVFSGTLSARNDSVALGAARLAVGGGDSLRLVLEGDVTDVLTPSGIALQAKLDLSPALALDIEDTAGLGRLTGTAVLADRDGSVGLESIEIRSSGEALYQARLWGEIDDLAELDEIALHAEIEVPDPSVLARTFGEDIGRIERFRFGGDVAGSDERIDARGDFTIGTTELSGALGGSLTGVRPRLAGSLTSKVLRTTDFGFGQAASDAAVDVPPSQTPTDRVFGNEPLPFEALSDFDLDLHVEIDEIEGVLFRVDRLTTSVLLENGLLVADPLRFDFVGGSLESRLRVDAASDPPTLDLQAVANDLDLETIFNAAESEVPVDGELDLRIDLSAQGRSPRELAESLDGTFAAAMSRGRILVGFFDLAAIDPISWVFSSEARQGYSPISCFIVNFETVDGQADSEGFLLDTPSVRTAGAGEIDLDRERLNLAFEPRPKERRLIELTTPFRVRGPLAAPELELSTAGAATTSIGNLLFSPINALGSLLSLVDDDGADAENPCVTQ